MAVIEMALQKTQSALDVFAGLFAPAIAPDSGSAGKADGFARALENASGRKVPAKRDTRPEAHENGERSDASASVSHSNTAKPAHTKKKSAVENQSEPARQSVESQKVGNDNKQDSRTSESVNSVSNDRPAGNISKASSKTELSVNHAGSVTLIEGGLTVKLAANANSLNADVLSAMTDGVADVSVSAGRFELNPALDAMALSGEARLVAGEKLLETNGQSLKSPDLLQAKEGGLDRVTQALLAEEIEKLEKPAGKDAGVSQSGRETRVIDLSFTQKSGSKELLHSLAATQSAVTLQAKHSKSQQYTEKSADAEKSAINTQDGLFDDQFMLKPQTNQSGSNLNPVAQMAEALKRQADSAAAKAQEFEPASVNSGAKSHAEFSSFFKSDLTANAPVKGGHAASAKVIIPDNFGEFVRGKANSITLKISPAHLGEAKLSVSVRKHQVHGALLVESMAAKSAIESSLDKLVERLAQEGLQLDRLDVEVSGDQWREDHHATWERSGRHNNRRFTLENDDEASLNVTPIAARPAVANVVGAHGVNALA